MKIKGKPEFQDYDICQIIRVEQELPKELVLSTFGFILIVFETESYEVPQAGFKFVVLLPQPPKCWYYTQESPYPTSIQCLSSDETDFRKI